MVLGAWGAFMVCLEAAKHVRSLGTGLRPLLNPKTDRTHDHQIWPGRAGSYHVCLRNCLAMADWAVARSCAPVIALACTELTHTTSQWQ